MSEAVQRASRIEEEEEASLQVSPVRLTGNEMSLVPSDSHRGRKRTSMEKANATTYQGNTQ